MEIEEICMFYFDREGEVQYFMQTSFLDKKIAIQFFEVYKNQQKYYFYVVLLLIHKKFITKSLK